MKKVILFFVFLMVVLNIYSIENDKLKVILLDTSSALDLSYNFPYRGKSLSDLSSGEIGYLESLKPVGEGSYSQKYFKVNLESGKTIYFNTIYMDEIDLNKGLGSNSIMLYSKYLELENFNATPIYPNSDLIITNVEKDYSFKYTINNKYEIDEEELTDLKNLAAKLGNNDSITELLLKCEVEFDDFNGRYFIKYPLETFGSYIKLYIGLYEGMSYIRLKVLYNASDWLFINEYQVKTNSGIWTSGTTTFERDNSSGDIWEWIDFIPDEESIQLILNIINSKDPIIRFQGKQYHRDFKIPKEQIDGLEHILALYKKIVGFLNEDDSIFPDTGTLELSVWDSCDLYINDNFLQNLESESTVKFSNIQSGDHLVEFRYPEYTDKHEINVIKNNTTFIKSTYESNPFFKLNISSDGVKDISIFANNEFLGIAPLSQEFPVGEYLISFKAPHINTKSFSIDPKSREQVDLNMDDLEYKYGEILLEGLPFGTEVSFMSNHQTLEKIQDSNLAIAEKLIIGDILISFKHKLIQDFTYKLNLNENDITRIRPDLIKLGLLELSNDNVLPTLVKLTPVSTFKEETIFPDLEFEIKSGESLSLDLPEGLYNANYFKPNDNISGLENEILIEFDSTLKEKIKKFDYSIAYRLKEKNKLKSELTNKIQIIKKSRSAKSTGGWALIIGGLGPLGYAGYNYYQIGSTYDNYSSALTTSDAAMYKGDIENLQMKLSISAIAGGISFLIGTIINATLPSYQKESEQLREVELDITLLESKMEL